MDTLGLPISIESLLHGQSVEWERLEFKKELELTEGRSAGLRKIKRAIAKNGSPDPVFETDDDRSYFLVRFPVHPDAMRSPNVGQVTQQVMKLLNACEGEMSRAELMRAVGIKDRVSFSKNYLDAAIADDLIEMSQPGSPNSPTQKYSMTKRGRNIVEAQK